MRTERRAGRRVGPVLGAVAVGAIALALAPGGVLADGALVTVDRYRITPPSIEIERGGTVTFHAAEQPSLVDAMVSLTLVAEEGAFRSPALSPGESWRFTFERTGIYPYHVEEHPGVDGVIVVE